MKLLIDTCVFLWWVDNPAKLSQDCRRLCADPDNAIYLSAVSAWEIALKYALGRLTLSDTPDRYVPRYRALHDIDTLDVSEDDTLHLIRLPNLHRDPFDRMLVCQAVARGLTVVTPDPLITQYPIRTIW